MLGQTTGIEKTAKCEVAVSEAYTIAKFGSNDDTLALAGGASDGLIGVLQHTTGEAGEDVRVMLTGISRVVLGGNVTLGARLTSDALGRAVAASRHAHTENAAEEYTQNAVTGAAPAVNVIGIALSTGAAGDIIPVLLAPSMV